MRGKVRFSGVASLRIASAVRLSCASGAVGCFPTANRFTPRLGRGRLISSTVRFLRRAQLLHICKRNPYGGRNATQQALNDAVRKRNKQDVERQLLGGADREIAARGPG